MATAQSVFGGKSVVVVVDGDMAIANVSGVGVVVKGDGADALVALAAVLCWVAEGGESVGPWATWSGVGLVG